jgi:hypothetical protein
LEFVETQDIFMALSRSNFCTVSAGTSFFPFFFPGAARFTTFAADVRKMLYTVPREQPQRWASSGIVKNCFELGAARWNIAVRSTSSVMPKMLANSDIEYFSGVETDSLSGEKEHDTRPLDLAQALCRAYGPRLRFGRKLLAPSASMPGPPTELAYRSGSL